MSFSRTGGSYEDCGNFIHESIANGPRVLKLLWELEQISLMSLETELNEEGRQEWQWNMRPKLRSRLDSIANEYKTLKKPT